MQQPMHIPLTSKPHPAMVCVAGVRWMVLGSYMRVSTAEQRAEVQFRFRCYRTPIIKV